MQRPRGVDDAEADHRAAAQLHAVAREHLLRADHRETTAHVDAVDAQAGPEQPVPAGLEQALVAALAVEQAELGLVDVDAAQHDQPTRGDHRQAAGV